MATKITDATPWLKDLVDKYVASSELARTTAVQSIDQSLSDIEVSLSEVPDKIESYIKSNPINMYVDGTVFRNAVTSFQNAVGAELGNVLNQVVVGYGVRKDNIQIDFNQAMSDANDSFNGAFYSGVVIDDPDYETKRADAVSEIQAASDYAVEVLTSEFTRADDEFVQTRDGVVNLVSTLIKDHVFNRPLIRSTGKFYAPSYPNFGIQEEYGLQVTNVGNKPWVGSIGLSLTDEYYKNWTNNDPSVFGTTVKPGETVRLTRMFTVPKVVYVKGNPRNFGKTITYKIMINTKQ